MFLLKKYLSAVLYPYPLCFFIIAIGVVFLWTKKRRGWGRWCVTVGIVLLGLGSCQPLPRQAVRSLENNYAVFDTTAHSNSEIKWIVVLGGGVTDDPALPPNDQLSAVSLVRTIEGIRILKYYPEANILFCADAQHGVV